MILHFNLICIVLKILYFINNGRMKIAIIKYTRHIVLSNHSIWLFFINLWLVILVSLSAYRFPVWLINQFIHLSIYRYLSGGIESGFRKVERNVFEKRLLHVKGKRNVRVTQVFISLVAAFELRSENWPNRPAIDAVSKVTIPLQIHYYFDTFNKN